MNQGRNPKRRGPPPKPQRKPPGGRGPNDSRGGPNETRGGSSGGGGGSADESTIDLKSLKQSLRDPNHKFKGQRFDRYDLLSEIGRGAMGVVLRAKHSKLGSLVALKLLASDDPTPEASARFTREATVLAKLSHENVVGITDLGEDKGIQFLAMELIEGPDLHEVISKLSAKKDHLSVTRSVEIAAAMAKALAYCHESGAIHRDIKPQNILIEHQTDRPVLTDFGLVKRDSAKMESGQSAAISQAGKILGTPSFMSPEQFEPDGEYGAVGEKSDVWGLAATLFFCLTGQPPFKAANVVNLYSMVLHDPHPKASNLRPGIPQAIDDLLDECFRKQVSERISMQDLAKRLGELAANPKALESGGSGGLKIALAAILVIVVVAIALNPDKFKRLMGQATGEDPQTTGSADGSADGSNATGSADGSSDGSAPTRDPAEQAKIDGLRDKAKGGDAAAMEKLATRLAKSSVAAEQKEALDWATKAADAGNAKAMLRLGIMHSKGQGTAASDAKAAEWFTKAAEKGDVVSMFWLADLYSQGKVSGKPEPQAALDWLEKVLATEGLDANQKADAEEKIKQIKAEHPGVE